MSLVPVFCKDGRESLTWIGEEEDGNLMATITNTVAHLYYRIISKSGRTG
jgi:hypothetical protein